MSSLQISQGTFRLSDTKTLKIDHLSVAAGESWAFVGSNGSGKSALARALAGDLPLLSGQRESHFSRVTRLSFEQLQKLVSDEWQRNNTDLLSPGEEDTGRTTAEIIQDEVKDPARCARLAEQFGISALLDRRFKYLSTGETRKTLLCQALMTDPQLLILDEPFDGLDVNSRQQLAALLADLHSAGITLVLVLNRFDEIPEFVQFAGVLADCTLSETGEKSSLLQQALVYNPDNSDKARLTNFQGWRTGFYDPQLNTMIDQALLERDPQKQVADYQAIQTRYDQLVPALIPLSQMVDSVVVRNEVREYQPHPSATTFLRDVYKVREGEKG